ncbi:hypothetical protein FB45DRAFT_340099 [Roridomyces roridus]|uniref:Uncharacterized protein n=1 Tax=Roridomyces roridus TaxID=1738132 RepID=A0AAD7B3V9_9AGAR|nr:hypothetical protein FB45DRAFT_340099 [Roridomyces roridus]
MSLLSNHHLLHTNPPLMQNFDHCLPTDMESTFRTHLINAESSMPLTSGMTLGPEIELSMSPPVFHAPPYPLHGAPLSVLPEAGQQFLVLNGLGDPTALPPTPQWVAHVRGLIAHSLLTNATPVCQQIVTLQVLYNANRGLPHLCASLARDLNGTLLPKLSAHVSHHLMLADALIWAEISGHPENLDGEDAAKYRALQIQPLVELVANHVVNLYTWLAQMWNAGWRMDAHSRALYRINSVFGDAVGEAARKLAQEVKQL